LAGGLAKVGEELGTQGVEMSAPALAGAYYHLTDARFTAWGASSKVMVPQLATKIQLGAKMLSGVGWAVTDAVLAQAIYSCSSLLQ